VIEAARYVPQRVRSLTGALAEHPWNDDSVAPERFREFARLVAALYHFEFHDREQTVVELWEHLADGGDVADRFSAELSGLLDGANYEALSMAELEDALQKESLLKVSLDVDLDDYDELMVYHRGAHADTVELQRWKGLRSPEKKTITVDERVVVHTRVKEREWFDRQGVDPVDRNLVPGHASLQQFVDVPRADIEMLLPSVQVKFRFVDRLVLGVPAVASGVVVLATKLLPTLGLIFLLFAAWLGLRDDEPELDQAALVLLATGLFTLGVFVVRQWTKLKNRRIEYWKTLTENLYFRTLGTGGGVLHELLASAEEQEVAEVVLAARFLFDASAPISADELDRRIEEWLRMSCEREIDFEVDDALGKLERLGVIDPVSPEGMLVAVPIDDALATLDDRWDHLFEHGSAHRRDAPEAAETTEPTESVPRQPLIRLRRVMDRFRSRLGERKLEREAD
jgi:Protein of unknown function (DUF3754)